MNIKRNTGIYVSVSLLTASPFLASPGSADEIQWRETFGGFHDPNDWFGGVVPGDADTAVFSIPSVAFVSFNGPAATDRLIIRSLPVHFELQGYTYTLLNPSINAPGIVVGEQFGDHPDLEILNEGTLAGTHMLIGAGHGADAVVNLGEEYEEEAGFLSIGGYLGVGQEGAGSLRIHHGLVETGFAVLGSQLGSYGAVEMNNPDASWINGSNLTVGRSGDGLLHVRNGAELFTGSVIVGQNVDSSASVIIDGPGTWLNITGELDLGLSGDGHMQVLDGATVTVTDQCTAALFTDFTLLAHIELHDPATATLEIRGEGSSLVCDGLFTAGVWGHIELTISDGAQLVANGLELSSGFGTPSILRGDGTVMSDVGLGEFDPGVIAPGDPFGELTIDGDVEGVNLHVEVAGTALDQFDRLTVTGSFDGLTLTAQAVAPYAPTVGDSFEIVTAGSVGEFDQVISEGLPAGLAWGISYEPDRILMTVIPFQPADLDNSGEVDAADLAIVLGNWGVCDDPEDCPADLDGDGVVGAADLAIVLGNWGPVT